MSPSTYDVAIIGGGVVGAATLFTLAHRGVATVLLEAEPSLGYSASGTNSGVLHTGFDSTAGQLETEMILRSAAIRPAVLEALRVPVLHCGAELVPHSDSDRETIRELAENAGRNGVQVELRESDGALLVPGESVTDPVAFTLALGASGQAAGGEILTDARVIQVEDRNERFTLTLEDGRSIEATAIVNAAGLYADEVARLIGDDSFEIYPRKGEFFVFELPGGERLEKILLPVPTKRTKGVLVFPTLDGRVTTGPTAVDLTDKTDWSVRPEAQAEILPKATAQFPALEGLSPVASYAGLRPAGRDTNYVIAPSIANSRFINVAAIRSTGLSACLGIADYLTELLPSAGVAIGERQPIQVGTTLASSEFWWQRTARFRTQQPSNA
jgi:glycerol-3-phosphate dehydrogenase